MARHLRLLCAAGALLLAAGQAQALTMLPLRHAQPVPVYHCVPGDNGLSLNGLLANGGSVQIGPGMCHLTHGLVVTVSGTTLNGAGMGLTILQASNPTVDIITLGSGKTASVLNAVTISNLTTDGQIFAYGGPRAKAGRGLVVGGTVHADANHPVGASFSNVEVRYSLSGANMSGSDIVISNMNMHGNRKIGLYVAGNSRMPQPYNYADNYRVTASRFDANNLDNRPGDMISDTIDVDRQTSNFVYGGKLLTDGNEMSGGDLVLSCDQIAAFPCTQPVGPYTVQHNSFSGGSIGGVRVFGLVTGAKVLGNSFVATQGTGVTVVGTVRQSSVINNVITGLNAYGVHVFPLAGTPMGDSILLRGNSVTMAQAGKPAFSVSGLTNVTLLNNTGNGASYDTAQAGVGLTMTGNH